MLASDLEDVDWGPLVRARDETESTDVAGVESRRDQVLAALDGLASGEAAP